MEKINLEEIELEHVLQKIDEKFYYKFLQDLLQNYQKCKKQINVETKMRNYFVGSVRAVNHREFILFSPAKENKNPSINVIPFENLKSIEIK